MKSGWVLKWVGFSLAAGIMLLSASRAQASAALAQQGFDCAAQTAMPEDQCLALVALYNSAGGSGWVDDSGWMSSPDPCGWYGVTCSEGQVVALDLFGNNLTGTLPIEIGSLTGLRTLTLNDNSLSGEIPLTITFLDLDLFHFHNTSLCEPADPAFQDWIFQIVYRLSSGQYCSPLTPSATPDPAQPTSVLNGPQQTLTALALVAPPTATLQPTATRVSTQAPSTATPTSSAGLEGGSAPGGDQQADGAAQNGEQGGLFSRIPPVWGLLLVIPVLLIISGILLELRERRTSQPDHQADEDADYFSFDTSDTDRLS